MNAPDRRPGASLFYVADFALASGPQRLQALEGQARRASRDESRILHHAVIDLAEAQADDVQRVILVEPPRALRALLGHLRNRALHVAGGEIQPWPFRDRGIDIVRHASLVAVLVHVVD